MKTNHSPRGRKYAYICIACLMIIGTVASIKTLSATGPDKPNSTLGTLVNEALLGGSKLAMGIAEMYLELSPKGSQSPKGLVRKSQEAKLPNDLPQGVRRVGMDQPIGASGAQQFDRLAISVFSSASQVKELASTPVTNR